MLVLIIGATYGAVSAFAGGWVDNIMMRITDILYTIPDILLIILLGMALKDRWMHWLPSPVSSGCRPLAPT